MRVLLIVLLLVSCIFPTSSVRLNSINSNSFANTVKQQESSPKPLKWVPNGVKNGIASAMATAVTKVALQPFDTIKTIQQLQEVKINALATGISIVKARGMSGLWSGVGVTVIGATPSVACYFGVYSAAKKRLIPLFPIQLRLLAIAIAAVIGNSLASVLRVPYEIFKQRIQAGEHQTILEAVNYSIKHEGLKGMFGTGKLTSQIMRDVPYAVVTLVSYELLQAYITKKLSQRITVDKTAATATSSTSDIAINSHLDTDLLASTLEDEGADVNILNTHENIHRSERDGVVDGGNVDSNVNSDSAKSGSVSGRFTRDSTTGQWIYHSTSNDTSAATAIPIPTDATTTIATTYPRITRVTPLTTSSTPRITTVQSVSSSSYSNSKPSVISNSVTHINNNNAKKLQDGFCGSLAGGLGAFCTTPMDVVKTRLMTSNSKYTSIPHAILSIINEEGLSTFFIGTSSRLLHKIPANGLFFLCYESFRTLLGVEDEAEEVK